MDNQITFNPPHSSVSTRINGTAWPRADQIHPAAFRVAGTMLNKTLNYTGSNDSVTTAHAKMEYIVIDATRCQNGEEFATILGAAINTFPGAGALKALGGTHMPSMGNAMMGLHRNVLERGTAIE